MTSVPSPGDPGRRNFLTRLVFTVHAAMGGVMALVLGGAALAPGFLRRDARWLRAAPLDSLRDGEPVPVTLRVTRQDGYAQVVDRTVVFLVRTGGESVRALSSTCTHLGCRTSYDPLRGRIVCPCHGGVFGVDGAVQAGPPPGPLQTLDARVEGGHVLVRV